MPDTGFLGEQPETKPEVQPTVEVAGEVDEYALAERQAEEEALVKEAKEDFLEAPEQPTPAATAAQTVVVSSPPIKDEVMLEVEKILEQGLGDFVAAMPETARQRFQQKGTEVAGQIADMVRRFSVKIKKVLTLIRDWLLTIPGVNKYFLEQEAKIKADRIVDLEKFRRDQAAKQP